MNQTRAFLLFAWVAVAILLAFEWTRFTAEPAPSVEAPVPAPASLAPPPVALGSPSTAPTADTLAPPTADAAVPAGAMTAAPEPAATTQVELVTDVLRLRIDPRGGTVAFAELLAYPLDADAPQTGNVVLLSDDPSTLDVARSGVLGVAGAPAPDHTALYRVEGDGQIRRLADGQDGIELALRWTDPSSGLVVRKVFTVLRGSYAITVRHELANAGSAPFVGQLYQRLERVPPPPASKTAMFTNPESFSFTGAAWYSAEDAFEKRAFADFVEDGPLNKTVTGGWIAMLQHHFVSAWVPPTDEAHTYALASSGSVFAIDSKGSPFTVAPGATQAFEHVLWAGPKLQAPLAEVADTLPLALDYGIFSFLAQPLFWLLNALHGLLGNWGWAIIGIVVILKAALFWFSAKQYQSMAKMRAIAPRLEQLKERYGDDRVKFNQAMMELYQKEKINPLGGCLPMLVPIPIFIALYWVLLESVELRHAPWIGWITNLTAPDPYFILPALNLAVMWATQKLTPPSPGMDPTQQKILQWMPVVFGVMFAFFPAGLVLYWFVNGLLGLVQQWYMTKKYSTPANPSAAIRR